MSGVGDSNVDQSSKPKRKKTNRACNHCHKAHMTCDSSRPCKRCTQRGLEATCEDAPRKRKKYLADVPNVALNKARMSSETDLAITSSSDSVRAEKSKSLGGIPSLIGTNDSDITSNSLSNMSNNGYNTFLATVYQHSNSEPIFPNQDLYNINYQPLDQSRSQLNEVPVKHQIMPPNRRRRTNFLSSAADLEYSTLSSILQDNFTQANHSTSNEGTPNSITLSPVLSPHNLTNLNQRSPNDGYKPPLAVTAQNHLHPQPKPYQGMPQNENHQHLQHIPHPQSHKNSRIYDTNPHYPKCDESINQYFLGPTESDQNQLFPNVITAIETMRQLDPAVYQERNSQLTLSFTIGIVPEDNHNYKTNESNRDDGFFKEPEEIYAKVNKPFSYTPGYHSLIAYLRKRFNKPMLVKMAESMAAYRPSFIACTNSLKEGDLIFMEQCFQRTLLTYDNFIRVNGTPTIVWRRTGEIAYVGNEFCILTGWKKDELIGRKRFIVELLDDKSVVEYFQLFLRIAFGDFLGATMTECTLLTPNHDVKIRTGCMWTLKRDVFGIPMMIIGNFLPIL